MKKNNLCKARVFNWSIALLLILPIALKAQHTDGLMMGSRAPEFWFEQVRNYKQSNVSLENFKGKWLILDFWSRTCSSCIQSFPKISKLQGLFKDQIQFLMVGRNDKKYNEGIEKLYDRLYKGQDLQMAAAFDTLSFSTYKVTGTPEIVIIDPQGIVRYVTYSQELTKEKLQHLLEGKEDIFLLKGNTNTPALLKAADIGPLAGKKEILINEKKGLVPHSSKLTKWQRGEPVILYLDLEKDRKEGYFMTNTVSLERLYKLAYLGNALWNRRDSLYQSTGEQVVLEITDSTDFRNNFFRGIGLYNYEVQLAEGLTTSNDLMNAMKADLLQIFGYNAVIEKRKLPCLDVVLRKNFRKKLLAKDTITQIKGDASGYSFKHITIEKLLGIIEMYHHAKPIFDKTGIDGSIDLDLNAIMLDFNKIKKELKKKGLNLVEVNKEMDVLIIRNKTVESSISPAIGNK